MIGADYQFIRSVGGSGSANGYFNNPYGIAVDLSGNVWVADTNNSRIQEFDSNGNFLRAFGTYGSGNGQFKSPQGIAVDSLGNVWVSDRNNYRIQQFDCNGNYLKQFGTYGTDNGCFVEPVGLTVDSLGNVWVADPAEGLNLDRIKKFNSNGTYLTELGAHGSSNGQFNACWDVAVDSTGNVWVADALNDRIQEFSSVPEPSTVVLLSLGAISLLGLTWRGQRPM